jgi:hypothetical protein
MDYFKIFTLSERTKHLALIDVETNKLKNEQALLRYKHTELPEHGNTPFT